ncbi:MAG: ral nucleoside transport system ATP-binding protein [Gaiellales bacterium]|nr:ral nucleoside transport system ATP-binding protein [Gaiellales bacterium]
MNDPRSLTAPVPAVTLRGVTKRFPGVVANADVDLEIHVGEVHALLGENGAGKSTLSNIVTGLYRPDEGSLELHGKPVELRSPRDALAGGVGMVHQHFRLVEPFTVAENIALGDQRDRRLVPDRAALERKVAALAEQFGLAVDPRARIWQLSVGEQQRVEILKALYRDARVLILDEPTAVLTPQEARALFETLRAMAADGRAIVFISHKLHEVLAVSDRITVLRGGRVVATLATGSATPEGLAALMVGREVETGRRQERTSPIGDAVLEAHDLRAEGDRGLPALNGVSLTVRAGEIVGVAGVAGNGQRELAESLTGLRPLTSGRVTVGGEALRAGDPRDAIAHGVAHVPEDRLGTGVASSLSIASNTVLKAYRDRDISAGPFLRRSRIMRRASDLIAKYSVRASGPEVRARDLSGGNLQKVVIGREFAGEPRVLVVAAPTRGLDVGAIENVHELLRAAAARGVAVLMISEDLDEILALADRVLVMYEGAIAGERDGAGADVDELGMLMAGGARS